MEHRHSAHVDVGRRRRFPNKPVAQDATIRKAPKGAFDTSPGWSDQRERNPGFMD